MATLLASLMTKYDSLSAANFPGSSRPPAFEEPVPDEYNGAALYVPYVTLAVEAAGTALTFEYAGVAAFKVTVTAYAYSQADTDATIAAVRYNGAAAASASGFDLGSLAAFDDGRLLALRPDGPPRPGFAGWGKDAKRVHTTTMTYTADVQK